MQVRDATGVSIGAGSDFDDQAGFRLRRCGIGKGGKATLFVNGKSVGTGRIEQTQGMAFSADEGADVGADEGTAVSEGYKVPFKFTGKIDKVTIDLKPMAAGAAIEAREAHRQAVVKMGLSN